MRGWIHTYTTGTVRSRHLWRREGEEGKEKAAEQRREEKKRTKAELSWAAFYCLGAG